LEKNQISSLTITTNKGKGFTNKINYVIPAAADKGARALNFINFFAAALASIAIAHPPYIFSAFLRGKSVRSVVWISGEQQKAPAAAAVICVCLLVAG